MSLIEFIEVCSLTGDDAFQLVKVASINLRVDMRY